MKASFFRRVSREQLTHEPDEVEGWFILGTFQEELEDPAADPAHSPAGQPGRCQWCHEGHLMIGQPQPEIDGYLGYDEWRVGGT